MLVSEIFLSIQGESTYVGLPCIFVRLAGCNLSCDWCDTTYAASGDGAARRLTVDEVMEEVGRFDCGLVEVTGGEPLMQDETRPLVTRLLAAGYHVLLETNGSLSLRGIEPEVVKIVDVKCPSSGQQGTFLMDNMEFIDADDEIKFVIADRADYEYARSLLPAFRERTRNVLFAPVKSKLEARKLADWILEDSLDVRLQLQIHTYIWSERR